MPRPKTETTRVNSYLPNHLLEATKKLARSRGVSYSEIMRAALLEYLQKVALNSSERARRRKA